MREAVGDTTGNELKKRLLAFSDRTGIRRVRVTERLTVIGIPDSPFKSYKGDSNYAFEIYRDESGRWKRDVVTTFVANQVEPIERLRDSAFSLNGKPLVMRLCKNDLIAIEEDGRRRIMLVVKFGWDRVTLAEHQEANTRERNDDKIDAFRYKDCGVSTMFELKARRVFVDLLGHVLDPGFRP